MNLTIRIFVLLLGITTWSIAQNKPFTLAEIWGGAFQTERPQSIQPMPKGAQYSVLETDAAMGTTEIVVYDYATGEKLQTPLSTAIQTGIPSFQSYTFSPDGKQMLLATALEPIYRYSSRGIYYIYDIASKGIFKINDKKIQEPTLSPDGTKLAYVLDRNLFVLNFTTGEEIQLTDDGKANEISNGITDWVYEEEFAVVRAFDWSADSNKVAFLRFDEREVPEYTMQEYHGNTYPQQTTFKYPKAGEQNAKVALYIADLTTMALDPIPIEGYKDFYIPRLQWTKDPNILSIQVLNRHQDQLDIIFVDAKSKSPRVVLSEKDDAYVEVTDHLTFLKDHSFLWTSEKDGYNHLYHYTSTGELITQVTTGEEEVTKFYGWDEKNKQLFYQSVAENGINRDVYTIKLDGKGKKKLSTKAGNNDADFSADFSTYINYFSDVNTPYEFTVHKSTDGKLIRELKNNNTLRNTLKAYDIRPKEFSTLDVDGVSLNMWMMKPANFDPKKAYPLFLTQYSGPGSQSVQNRWHHPNDYWYMSLAQQGYIVACIDGRGTGYKGAKFKKVTQNNLGNIEVQDQIAAAKQLSALPYIDASRVGIWGWSYGGFMSSLCVFKAPEVFKMAIAVAPVTDWRFYDTIYTERYLRTPQENPKGYEDNSPINFVNGLAGRYLLIHGSADDNVHVQHSMELAKALIHANKQFEWAIYPDKNHGIYGGATREHLYAKMTNFIKSNL